MVRAFSVIILVFLFGCYQGPSRLENFTNKVRAWQSRESTCDTVITQCPDEEDLYDNLMSIRRQIGVDYKAESGDIWKTSQKTMLDGSGDCEDLANTFMRALYDSCIPDFYNLDIRSRIIAKNGGYHVVCIIYSDEETYEMSNYSISYESDFDTILEYDLKSIF